MFCFGNWISNLSNYYFILLGKILPRKMRLRRSSKTMYYDPYTLYITPGVCNTATGTVYVDDESSFAYQTEGAFKYRLVTYGNHQIRSQSGGESFLAPGSTELLLSHPEYQHGNTVERIVLLGQTTAPKRIVLSFDGEVATAPEKKITREMEFFVNSKDKTVTIKKPDVPISVDWVISLEY
jgi:alpha 1,3-glucosidase